MKFKVKLPPIAGPNRLAGTVVVTTMSPNEAPPGVLMGSVVPLNVIVVVPLIFVKLTTFVPLILKTPVVLKVTGKSGAGFFELSTGRRFVKFCEGALVEVSVGAEIT